MWIFTPVRGNLTIGEVVFHEFLVQKEWLMSRYFVLVNGWYQSSVGFYLSTLYFDEDVHKSKKVCMYSI